MKHYILYGHDGSGNHGCEALARTTAELLDYQHNHITLVSTRPEEDRLYHVDQLCRVVSKGARSNMVRKNADFLRAYYELKVKHKYSAMDDVAELQAIGGKRGDIALSIGGDSYCYGDNLRKELIRQHNLYKEHRIKTVYWGCSIEPELLNRQEIIEDFHAFDLITARESISFELLKQLNPNTILVADSAFVLKGASCKNAEGRTRGDIIGINTSPLIELSNSDPKIVRANYEHLIETILNDTDFQIWLIPHVVWKGADDRTILQDLYNRYKHSDRITLYPDMNCQELKYIISQCRFFVGARTHATIAAYSSGVPTIVMGYSTKSKGIATDLFGTYDNFVIPVQEIASVNDLTDHWKWLRRKENVIRDILKQKVCEMTDRIHKGQKTILKIL